MRSLSWAVVAGSVAALLYTGAYPLLKDMRLPRVDESTVSGTAVSVDDKKAVAVINTSLSEAKCEQAQPTVLHSDDTEPKSLCEPEAVVQN